MAYVDDLHVAVQLLRAGALGGEEAIGAQLREVPDDQLRPVLTRLAWLAGRWRPLTVEQLDAIESEVTWLCS